jgi:hypothetical protein
MHVARDSMESKSSYITPQRISTEAGQATSMQFSVLTPIFCASVTLKH